MQNRERREQEDKSDEIEWRIARQRPVRFDCMKSIRNITVAQDIPERILRR